MARKVVFALVLALCPLLAKSAIAQEEGADIAPPPPPPGDENDTFEPPEAAPPQRAPDMAQFERGLSPYGRWVDTPEYGRVWIPSGVDSDWQPYGDGRWVDTARGWSFVAAVPWGWAAFHYGRWGWRGGLGWFWVPGFVWGPAWVSWRYVRGYACWSALAPRGFAYGQRWPGWVVVSHRHFTGPIHRFAVPRVQAGPIVRSARPVRAFPSARSHAFIGRGGGARHHGGGRRR